MPVEHLIVAAVSAILHLNVVNHMNVLKFTLFDATAMLLG